MKAIPILSWPSFAMSKVLHLEVPIQLFRANSQGITERFPTDHQPASIKFDIRPCHMSLLHVLRKQTRTSTDHTYDGEVYSFPRCLVARAVAIGTANFGMDAIGSRIGKVRIVYKQSICIHLPILFRARNLTFRSFFQISPQSLSSSRQKIPNSSQCC
jgi:hypothetical protein